MSRADDATAAPITGAFPPPPPYSVISVYKGLLAGVCLVLYVNGMTVFKLQKNLD